MKTRTSLIIAALLASIFTGCSKRPPKPTIAPLSVRFAGFTNGYVGAVAPIFATLTTNTAAAMQQWLTDGTNSAIFTISNQLNSTIRIDWIGRIICSTGPALASDETPVLNAPPFLFILLNPGQVTNLQVAVLPHQAPWRVRFYYTRFGDIGFLDELNSMILRKPIPLRTYTADSDLINQ